nr:nuclear hormone receptor family member nhr-85-like [Procambarus clarkii]XP_045608583.1 nuclear hormone receptor family member nhr-85-like [Procambarus clarkii]
MSKDGYYHFGESGSKAVEGLNLPSLPTTSYWYNAHSTVGSSLYPDHETSGTPPYKGLQQIDVKLAENNRDHLEWWTDDMCLETQPRAFDSQYWEGHPTERGYVQSSDHSVAGSDFEPSDQPLVLLSCRTRDHQDDYNSPELLNSVDIVKHDVDESSFCSESVSSQEYSPTSNNNNTPSNKKYTPETITPIDEHQRNQKRYKKEPKEKAKEDKRCGVCGDAARSMHFGGMACDSCKAFFRRSVQSGAYKSFQCPENKICPISKQNRKVCQYCRFKKSQENGMEINWVMSETDRMVLWKNRLAKQRHVQEEKIKDKVYGDLPRSLDPKEADVLRNLAALQESTFRSIPYPEDCYGDNIEALANLFVFICKKLGLFFQSVEDYQEVCKTDQNLLMKNGIGTSIYLHGAYMYDYENEMWPAECNKEALKIPPISMATLQKFTVLPEAFDAIMKYYNKYAKELKDEIILALICLISFFQPDDPQFLNSQQIQDIQLKYLELLRRYLIAKDGDVVAKITFPKLLVGLADIKEILEFHSKVDIKPTINHQHISPQSTVENQMSAVNELLQKASQGQLPEFSSILTASDKRQPLWQQSNAVRKKRSNSNLILRGDQFYHPQTSQIFGVTPRTDMIITNPMERIDNFTRKQNLPRAQINEVLDYEDDYRGEGDRQTSVLGRESVKAKNTSAVYHPGRQLQAASVGNNGECDQSGPIDKKRAVEVLCDTLQHISCADDEQFIQSLKQNLSPHLLVNLAEKLSPS